MKLLTVIVEGSGSLEQIPLVNGVDWEEAGGDLCCGVQEQQAGKTLWVALAASLAQ